ncbi:MAG: NAD(P)-dependent oxidoreductase [Verrucomicrobia bacterium]|nr:NAD(P)-dependent oxidoreductase [Verrucomicrobiota bacterium]
MNFLITGAAGRLGSCVCRILRARGLSFRAVDKVANSQTDFPIEVVDVQHRETCDKLLQGIDVLMHFANHANWNSSPAERLYIENATMNMNLFQAAADHGCGRIIFSSSIQVIDGQLPITDRLKHPKYVPYLPLDSEMPAIPRNSYALSKEAAERALKYFSETAGMTCIVIRYPLLVDSKMLRSMHESGGMLRGNAYDCFAYLPVYSGAEAAVLAATAAVSGFHNYFVASRDNLEQRAAREVIETELSHIPCKQPVETMVSLVDCSKVELELGWKQPKSLDESFTKYGELQSLRPYE